MAQAQLRVAGGLRLERREQKAVFIHIGHTVAGAGAGIDVPAGSHGLVQTQLPGLERVALAVGAARERVRKILADALAAQAGDDARL